MKIQSLGLSAIALIAAGLWSTSAHAEVGTAPFNPSTDFRAEELPISSGDIGTSTVSVELVLTPYQDVEIEMFGQGDYDFDATEMSFTGTEDAGVFTNTLGASVTVNVNAFGGTISIGVYEIEEEAVAAFTPYVLPGADPRPIEVAETIGPFNLLDEDFTVPGFGYPGNIVVDFSIEVPGISYQSTSIDITDDPDSAVPTDLGIYTMENSQLELLLPNATPGETTSVWGELNGTYSSEISFVFDISVTVDPGAEITVNEEFSFDIPIREDEPVIFAPEEMQFMVPEEPPAGSTGEPDPTTGDPTDSDSDSDTTTTGDDSGSSTGEPDTDSGGIPADGFGDSDSGCGCTTNPRSGGWTFGLALLGLLGLRRRQR